MSIHLAKLYTKVRNLSIPLLTKFAFRCIIEVLTSIHLGPMQKGPCKVREESLLMIAAIDIGGTKVACGIVAPDGEILAQAVMPTQPHLGAERCLGDAVALIKRMQADLAVSLRGVGVGCTGPVDAQTGVIGDVPFLPTWSGFELTRYLRDQLHLPVVLENDADAAALGELFFGAGRNQSHFVLVTLGTGVGGGIVLNGRLYRGAAGTHPEVGHMVIAQDGWPCSCGNRGCWEAYCGGQGFAAWVQARHPRLVPFSAEEIFQAASAGQEPYPEVVHEFGAYLGIGLSNLITLYAPACIALAGGVMGSRMVFWDTMQGEVKRRCSLVPAKTARIVPAQLGSHAGLIGAASAFLHYQELGHADHTVCL